MTAVHPAIGLSTDLNEAGADGAPAAAASRADDTAVPDAYWRTLHYFNVYRIASAIFFALLGALLGSDAMFGREAPLMYSTVCTVYAILAIGAEIATWLRRPAFKWQLGVAVLTDVACVGLLMYASGGVESGLGMMLMVTLAAAGLVSRGRHSFFYAALASVALLVQQVMTFLRSGGQDPSQFVHAALIAIAYFAVAALAFALARYARDTERLAAQRGVDLANLSQVNALVIRDMKDAVLVVDNDYRIRSYNERAETLLGPLSLSGSAPKLRSYSPELAGWLSSWRDNPDNAVTDMRSPVTAAPLRLRYVPIGEQRGASQGTLVFLEDTSQEQAEARQIKLAALGRLTANIAHEIRNPLSAISHAAELLEEEGERSEIETKMLRIIRDNAVRLDRMVQEVLQLNRRDRAQAEAIDPHIYLKAFVDDFCGIEKAAHDVVSLEIDCDLHWQFDRNHLHQVLWNLTRNAYRHGKKTRGSVRLCVSRAQLNDFVQVDVVDDGPGVDVDIRAQLFEPFFTTHSQGTGLGLYIARELCEANGAHLDYVDVAPGGQFRILIRGGSA